MNTNQRARNVILMLRTAEEIHNKYNSLRENGEMSVLIAKEYVEYCDITQDIVNMRRALERSSNNRFAIGGWCAVRSTQMSIESYIETYGNLDAPISK
ncbi:hypothetical protein A3C39_00440 [Candidatus Saccharibacteria bacterium RIFCSPHIGHO2_02_FULL_46_12]|jgi:hypothetical protein|nr:MAG: hypothetical protein A3C39_00440 [Candidatus Saccharibacteria bacterium RIFCSPHIGHO2_02_FULL_46_12]OGL31635.1 MAG: hypothetical protein A3E76_00780 [Candidatus Saccharibacteria bacterium RIFCSPHIGHO2_12_FULL_44_22]